MEQLTKDENQKLKIILTDILKQFAKNQNIEKELIKNILISFYLELNNHTNYQE